VRIVARYSLRTWFPMRLTFSFSHLRSFPVIDFPHSGEPPMPVVKPLFDMRIRDTSVCRGPGTTGKTGSPCRSINIPDAPLMRDIDALLLDNDNVSMYFLYGSNCLTRTRMNDAPGGLAGTHVHLRCKPAGIRPLPGKNATPFTPLAKPSTTPPATPPTKSPTISPAQPSAKPSTKTSRKYSKK
jgi:hypothetical protein